VVHRHVKLFKVMSFNNRTSSLPSRTNGWNDRKQLVLDIIRRHAPGIVCFQEVQQDQITCLSADCLYQDILVRK
jgi:hypothetical protein